MNPDKQRIAIAEACGFRWCWCHGRETSIPITGGEISSLDKGPKRYLVAPHGAIGSCGHEDATPDMRLDEDWDEGIPNYLSDLNAMHEAEKVLSENRVFQYTEYLISIVIGDNDGWWKCAHATAAQRAEAFLRTLGKWDDTK